MDTARKPAPGRRRYSDEDLLDAALEVFSQVGYQDATVEQVAAAAGTTKQTLHVRFSSKENLYVRMLQREADLLADQLGRAYAGAGNVSLREAVDVTMGAFFDFGAARRTGLALLFGTTRGGPATHVGHDLTARITSLLTKLIEARTGGRGRLAVGETAVLAAVCVGAARQACELVLDKGIDAGRARRLASTFCEAGLRAVYN